MRTHYFTILILTIVFSSQLYAQANTMGSQNKNTTSDFNDLAIITSSEYKEKKEITNEAKTTYDNNIIITKKIQELNNKVIVLERKVSQLEDSNEQLKEQIDSFLKNFSSIITIKTPKVITTQEEK